MIKIDGSYGEGGGQIVRTSLSLSMITGKEFTIKNIRAGRKKPGLLAQHLTALNASSQISHGKAEGASKGSDSFVFIPGDVTGGRYNFSVGTAGSSTLVLQTILPPLLTAESKSLVTIEGGTHNMAAPPFDFINHCFVPLVNTMGPLIKMSIERYGFYPVGGGKINMEIDPSRNLAPLELLKRGDLVSQSAEALYSKLPVDIAEDEAATVMKKLKINEGDAKALEVSSPGPGNILFIYSVYEKVTHVATSFGQKGVSRHQVARNAIKDAKVFEESGAVVDEHLADQLLIPIALAGKGAFITTKPSDHTLTNCEVIKQFLDIDFKIEEIDNDLWKISAGVIQ